jgi:hypothetical protein
MEEKKKTFLFILNENWTGCASDHRAKENKLTVSNVKRESIL